MNEKQNQLNQDSLNQEQTQEVDGDEEMSSEEWLKQSNKVLEILGATRTFKNAGNGFVMPYKMPSEETEEE